MIADKVANVLASDYPAPLLELIVASDGSDGRDRGGRARAGATLRPRPAARRQAVGAQPGGVEAASGEILVFTDADSLFEPGTLRRLVSNFADEQVGGVAANVVRCRRGGRPAGRARRGPVLALRAPPQAARGPGRQRGLGQRAPLRRPPERCSRPSTQTAGTDDFLISSQVVRAGAAARVRRARARASWRRPRRAAPSSAGRSA